MATTQKPRPHRALSPAVIQKYAQEYWSTGSHQSAMAATGRRTSFPLAKIRGLLQEYSDQAFEDVKGRRGRIITELESIAFSRITDYVTVDNNSVSQVTVNPSVSSAVESVKETKDGIQLKLYDKIKALETLAKITGLAVERIDVTSGGRPIQPIQMTFEVLPPPKRMLDRTMEVTVDRDDNRCSTQDTSKLAGANDGAGVGANGGPVGCDEGASRPSGNDDRLQQVA